MSDSFIGEIRMFGGTYAPLDWALCNGQALPIAQYSSLYQLIGTTYGGDGVTSFNLPDLRCRLPMHQGTFKPGTQDQIIYTISQSGGMESVTLQPNQLPAHQHVVRAKSGTGDQSSPANMVWAGAAGRFSASAPNLAMRPSAVGNAGGGQSHENMMPFLVVNFIICLNGSYPERG